MWISYMCLKELTILRVRSPSKPNVNPNFRQAIILRKDCQWTRLTTRLSKPGWRWETTIKHVCADSTSPRLVPRSRSFPPNCNQAKKQRLLQSCMFISTITSWDYGYQFFLLYWHVVVSKLKLSIFCERITPWIREIVSFEFGEEIEKDPRSDALTLILTDYGERGIRRSEVRFLMGTQKCFFFRRSWQEEKHLSLFLYRAQSLPYLLFQ